MDKLLSQHPLSNYSTYKEFIRDLIQGAVSKQEYTFEQLNYELYRLNTQIYQEFTHELITTHVYTSR